MEHMYRLKYQAQSIIRHNENAIFNTLDEDSKSGYHGSPVGTSIKDLQVKLKGTPFEMVYFYYLRLTCFGWLTNENLHHFE